MKNLLFVCWFVGFWIKYKKFSFALVFLASGDIPRKNMEDVEDDIACVFH